MSAQGQPSVFIYVQHLLGTGHAVRAIAIARALMDAGAIVRLATGNALPDTLGLEGLDWIQLPQTRSGPGGFTNLVDEDGSPIDDDWRTKRRGFLFNAVDAFSPDIVLTETFPFGRRQFRFELLPLLEHLKSRARPAFIACSIRDVLVRKGELRKEEEMADIADQFYDLILVHSDEALIPFSASFPFADRIEKLLQYTGYVYLDRSFTIDDDAGMDEVIVSAGGGAVGEALYKTALQARSLSKTCDERTWRILVGKNLAEDAFTTLQADAPDGIIVERARSDFPALLKRGFLSISQGGYNTVLDILNAGIRSVIVPFDTDGESEQMFRARLLERSGTITVLESAQLNPHHLAAAVDAAAQSTVIGQKISMNGASESARLLLDSYDVFVSRKHGDA